MNLYSKLIYEHFDPNNSRDFTKLMSLNEQEQDRVLVNLAAKLYGHITNEITDIDFGDIPKSKGDITKIPNYLDLVDCIDIIHNLCIRFKQSTTATDTLNKAIQNLKASKDVWETSFNRNVAIGMNTYNSLALSIVCSVSLIISTSIEYIKYPDSGGFDFILNKVQYSKTMDSVLFKSLQDFNKSYEQGDFMKAIMMANNAKKNISESEMLSFDENAALDAVLGASKNFINDISPGSLSSFGSKVGTVIGVASAIALLAAITLPVLRNAVHWFYSSRQKLSDYFAIQAALIEMNANNIRYNQSRSEKERKEIVDKQMKWADRFKSLSNKLSIKMKKAETSSKDTLEKEASQKMSMSDVENPGKITSLF